MGLQKKFNHQLVTEWQKSSCEGSHIRLWVLFQIWRCSSESTEPPPVIIDDLPIFTLASHPVVLKTLKSLGAKESTKLPRFWMVLVHPQSCPCGLGWPTNRRFALPHLPGGKPHLPVWDPWTSSYTSCFGVKTKVPESNDPMTQLWMGL